jgi:kynureninase
MQFENTLEFSQQLDSRDPLRKFRERFIIPTVSGKEQIYFLGNSLGLQSTNVKQEIQKVLDQWGAYGVEAFFNGDYPWMDYHDQLVQQLSPILGALPTEITVMNQLTVNLHLMMVSFYQPEGRANKILCEAKAFPSDQYMFETHLRKFDLNPDDVIIEVSPRRGERLIRNEDIIEAIRKHKDELALVMFSGVNYYTGQVFDIPGITKAAHDAGLIAGFDLAHAAANIPLQLHEWGVDFACWCSYKYLNSGPGAVGGCYVHERFHHDDNIQRFAGWWGYDKATRFQMEKGFKAIQSAEGWQVSTPSLLLYASHNAALNIIQEASWQDLQTKRKLLNDYLWFILDEVNENSSQKTIEFITPRPESYTNGMERGCQVSMLMLERGEHVFEELIKEGVMADWREPNVIRVAPVPLYNTFEEVWKFGNIIASILNQ